MAKRRTERPLSQRDRFIETARELGCDEDLDAFKKKLKVIARQKPKDESAPKKLTPRKPR